MHRVPRSRRACLRLGAAALTAAALPSLARPTGLERVRQRGALSVGLYHDMPPFHVGGQGIDVELARALAAALGVGASLLPFHADENMNDDLRNMVWRGHYLGFGPADVLLHVPVDRPLIEATPQARIFGPYYRERVAIARRLDRVPTLDGFSALAGQTVAVPGQTLAGWLLIGADGGAWRDRLNTQWRDGVAAARALAAGEVTLAAGLASELESVLAGDGRFALSPLPAPRAPREGWAIGMAVKQDNEDLARALQQAVNELGASGALRKVFARSRVTWQAG